MRRDKSRGAHMPNCVEPEVTLRDWLRMYHPKVLKEWDEAWVVWMSLEGYIKEYHPGLLQGYEAGQQGIAQHPIAP
jgi:hypothetical protein